MSESNYFLKIDIETPNPTKSNLKNVRFSRLSTGMYIPNCYHMSPRTWNEQYGSESKKTKK